MFEDQNQNQNVPQPTSQPAQQLGASSTQPGGVEDIFAGTDAGQAPSAVPAPPVIPGPPTALASGKIKPFQASGGIGAPPGQASLGQTPGSGFPFKKMLIIIGISLSIIGVAGVAFAMISGSFVVPFIPKLGSPQDLGTVSAPVAGGGNTAPAATTTATPPETGSNAPAAVPQDTGSILKNFQQNQIDRALNPIPQDPASIDTDQDGLLDAQEFAYGTNPRLVDSDNDGLSDWEEISIFGTDPLKADSDGDSYMDGEEVQNGYDPLGPGKLLNFEKANPLGE